METIAQFTHDCTGCVLLGSYTDESGAYDLYICKSSSGLHTVLARFGNEGPDYASVCIDRNSKEYLEQHPERPLAAAYRAACVLGYLP